MELLQASWHFYLPFEVFNKVAVDVNVFDVDVDDRFWEFVFFLPLEVLVGVDAEVAELAAEHVMWFEDDLGPRLLEVEIAQPFTKLDANLHEVGETFAFDICSGVMDE